MADKLTLSLDDVGTATDPNRPKYDLPLDSVMSPAALARTQQKLNPATDYGTSDATNNWADVGRYATDLVTRGQQVGANIANTMVGTPAKWLGATGVSDLLQAQKNEKDQTVEDKKALDAPLVKATSGFGDVAGPALVGGMFPVRSVAAGAGLGGGLGALEPSKSWADTAINTAMGMGGGALGSLLGKGTGKVSGASAGIWDDPNRQATNDMLNKLGIKTSIGDLDGKWEMVGGHGTNIPASARVSIPRALEDSSARSPVGGRQPFMLDQAAQVTNLMSDGKGELPGAIMRTYQKQDNIAKQKFDALDAIVNAPGSTVTNVKPTEFTSSLSKFVNTYGTDALASATPDLKLQARLLTLAGRPDAAAAILKSKQLNLSDKQIRYQIANAAADANGMSFGKLRDLQKSVGSLVGQTAKQEASGSANSQLAGDVKGLYSSLYSDLGRWSNNGRNYKANQAFQDAMSHYKENVLPYEQDMSMSRKAIAGGYDYDPTAPLSDAMALRNRGQMSKMVNDADPADRPYFMAPMVVDRGVKEGMSGATEFPARLLPMIPAALNYLPERIGRTQVGKNLYFGKDLSTVPGAAQLRGAAAGANAGALSTLGERLSGQRNYLDDQDP